MLTRMYVLIILHKSSDVWQCICIMMQQSTYTDLGSQLPSSKGDKRNQDARRVPPVSCVPHPSIMT